MTVLIAIIFLIILNIIGVLLIDKSRCDIFILKRQVEDLEIFKQNEEYFFMIFKQIIQDF